MRDCDIVTARRIKNQPVMEAARIIASFREKIEEPLIAEIKEKDEDVEYDAAAFYLWLKQKNHQYILLVLKPLKFLL